MKKVFTLEDMSSDILIYEQSINSNTDQDNSYLDLDIQNLDSLMCAYNETSDIYRSVNEALESGKSLSLEGLALTKLAIKNAYQRNNIILSENLFLSNETYANKVTSLSATRLTLENIAVDIYKIIKVLWKAINYVWNKIKSIIINLYNSLAGLKTNAEKIYKEIEGVPNNTSPLSDKLSISKEDHQVDTPLMRRIPFGISGTCDYDTASAITKSTISLVESHRDIIGNMVKCWGNLKNNPNEQALVAEVDNLSELILNHLSKLKLKNKKIDGNKVEYTYGYLVAGKTCEVTEYIAKNHDEQSRRIFNIDILIANSENTQTFVPSTLSKQEMYGLAKLSMELIDQVSELNKVIPIIEKALYSAEKHFMDNKESPETAELGLTVVRDLFRYTAATLPKLSLDSNRIASSIAHYVRDCIALYKGT